MNNQQHQPHPWPPQPSMFGLAFLKAPPPPQQSRFFGFALRQPQPPRQPQQQ